MKKEAQVRRISFHPFTAQLFLILLLAAVMALPAAAADDGLESEQHEHHAMSQQEGAPEQGTMMAMCQEMMSKRQQMMEKRQAMDEKLAELLDAVQSASGDAKVEAIEAVVEELVAQRRAMGSMMMEHHKAMMAHMMRHMDVGGMEMCPMMKGMMSKGESPETEAEHSEHHPN